MRRTWNVDALASSSSGSFSEGSAPLAIAENSPPASTVSAPSTSARFTSRISTLPSANAEKLTDVVDRHGSTTSCSSRVDFEADAEAMQENCNMPLQSSDYEKALEKLEALRKIQPENIDTLIMVVECHIFLDDFKKARETFEEAAGLAVLSDVEELVERSQHYRHSNMFFRSLNYICCACSVYQTRGTPEGILECLRNMEELLVQVVDKYGKLESPNCEKFAEFFLHQLMDLGELKESGKPENSAVLEVIHFNRYAGIAYCLLLLKRFKQSRAYFRKCIDLLSERNGGRKVNLSIVGYYAADVASNFNKIDEEFKNIEKHIDLIETHVDLYDKSGGKDLLKADLMRIMEDCAISAQGIRRTLQELSQWPKLLLETTCGNFADLTTDLAR